MQRLGWPTVRKPPFVWQEKMLRFGGRVHSKVFGGSRLRGERSALTGGALESECDAMPDPAWGALE